MTSRNTLPRSIPEDQGLSSQAILSFLDEIRRRQLELHGFMLLRHGYIIADGWWRPYEPQAPHAAYSLTKSFTSMATGFAVQEGLLSIEDEVLAHLPEMDTPEKRDRLKGMQIKHLLTMTTGHPEDTARFEVTPEFLRHRPDLRVGDRADRDPVRGFLELPVVHPPGTYFVYNSGASQLLGHIVERAAGVSLAEYLRPRLFEPLGIGKLQWDHLEGSGNAGGWGLWITTEAIARVGQFLLNKGVWNGKLILPSAWIEDATAFQADNAPREVEGDTTGNVDWGQGYGFQFWRCRHNAYRGDGAFGQFCIVLPDQDSVIAINGGLRDMQGVLDAVWDTLLPAMEGSPLPADGRLQEELADRLASLELGDWSQEFSSPWTGTKTYRLQNHEHMLQTLALTFADDRCDIAWTDGSGAHRISCGIGHWLRSVRPDGTTIAARGEWRDASTFEARVYPLDSPHYDRLRLRMEGQVIRMEHEHLNFSPIRHEYSGISIDSIDDIEVGQG